MLHQRSSVSVREVQGPTSHLSGCVCCATGKNVRPSLSSDQPRTCSTSHVRAAARADTHTGNKRNRMQGVLTIKCMMASRCVFAAACSVAALAAAASSEAPPPSCNVDELRTGAHPCDLSTASCSGNSHHSSALCTLSVAGLIQGLPPPHAPPTHPPTLTHPPAPCPTHTS
jgi:hypothetical protein